MELNEKSEYKPLRPGVNTSETNFDKAVKNLKTRYILKTCFTIVCLIGCVFQLVSIIALYFEYPTIVIIEKTPMEKLKIPGFTICNNNRIKRSRIVEYEPTFDRNWTEANKKFNDQEEKIKHQEIIDGTLRKMISELKISEFQTYGVNFEEFVDTNFTRCASDIYHANNPCKTIIKEITSVQESGNCFTLFHMSKATDMIERAIAPGFSNIPIKKGDGEALNVELSEEALQPNEVIRLKVNFSIEEYMTLNEPVMGNIVFHDEKEVPTVRRRSFGISPGNYYLFYLTEEVRYFLPKPYSTNCEKYVMKRTENDNQYLDSPLSKSDCSIGCMAHKCMDLCDCWPPEVPFIKGLKSNAKENNMKWCDWDELGANEQLIKVFQDKENVNKSTFQYCFSEHQKTCGKSCKNNCIIKSYLYNREVKTWPAIERIEHSKDSLNLAKMRNCCAIISIRYWSTMRTAHHYQPKLNDIEFMSYMGGLLSMWTGFSFIGFYEIFETVFKHIANKLKKRVICEENTVDRQLSKRSSRKSKFQESTKRQNSWTQYQKSHKKIYFGYGQDTFLSYNRYQ